jgi:hypothetical protein
MDPHRFSRPRLMELMLNHSAHRAEVTFCGVVLVAAAAAGTAEQTVRQ